MYFFCDNHHDTVLSTFYRFLGWEWNWRRADLGPFLIQPCAPPSDSGFSKIIFVAEKSIILISNSGRIIPTLTVLLHLFLDLLVARAPPPASGFSIFVFVVEKRQPSCPSSRSYRHSLQKILTIPFCCNFQQFFAYGSLTSSAKLTTKNVQSEQNVDQVLYLSM